MAVVQATKQRNDFYSKKFITYKMEAKVTPQYTEISQEDHVQHLQREHRSDNFRILQMEGVEIIERAVKVGHIVDRITKTEKQTPTGLAK